MPLSKEQATRIQDRVDKIILLLGKGFCTYADIYKFGEEDGWGVSTRTIDNYIKKAYDQMTKVVFRKLGDVHNFAINNFNALLQEALKRNELDLAFKVMKEVYRIGGAYDEEKREVTKAVNPHVESVDDILIEVEDE